MRRIKRYGLLALWLVFAGWMTVSYLGDPYDPALVGTARYGHNGDGALWGGWLASGIEMLVAYVLAQPFRATPWRFGRLVCIAALVPWLLVSLLLSMHAGSVQFVHLAWLVALLAYLLVIGLRRKPKPSASASASANATPKPNATTSPTPDANAPAPAGAAAAPPA